MRNAAFVLLTAAIAAGGCAREPTPLGPLDGAVSVHAVLRAATDTAHVLIARGVPTAAFPSEFAPVSGADVRITGPFGQVALPEAPPGMGRCAWNAFQPRDPAAERDAEPGCYAGVLPVAVRAGERYGLRITLPDGRVVTGETVVPAPVVLAPIPGPYRRLAVGADPDPDAGRADLLLEWTMGAAAAGATVTLRPGAAFAGGSAVPSATCEVWYAAEPAASSGGAGSAELRVFHAGCTMLPDPADPYNVQPVEWDSIAAVLQVAVFDTAFSRYVDEVGGVDAIAWHSASVGIQGAVGAFGGMAVAEAPLMLIRAGR
ncbi:MAG TPA: DUF4249 family protein [Longimicrobiales bacterium]